MTGIWVPRFDSDGNMTVSSEPREGMKYNLFSHNWCDKTSWYQESTKITDETLTDSGDGLTFNSANAYWVDMTHGKITFEDALVAAAQAAGTDDWLPIVKVDGTTKIEGTDFTIDYASGNVTFNASQSGKSVTATYWYALSGKFSVTVPAGKKLQLLRVELQFSKTIVLNDTMIFTPRGYASVFAPSLVPTPLAPTDLVDLQAASKYKNARDYINESNGSFPLIPPWGGLTDETVILVWEYITRTDLNGDWGMRIDIEMENDTPQTGEIAVATFYGTLTDITT